MTKICVVNIREMILGRLYDWSVKWKMIFNSDPTKPAEEIIFTTRNLTS